MRLQRSGFVAGYSRLIRPAGAGRGGARLRLFLITAAQGRFTCPIYSSPGQNRCRAGFECVASSIVGERLGPMEGLFNSTRWIPAALQTRFGGRFGPINKKSAPGLWEPRPTTSGACRAGKTTCISCRCAMVLHIVKPRQAIKSAKKHRSHPSMQLWACAPAVRCWSDR
jgi:hypothetical protein